ncbi:DUF1513 domain-containing protein [Fulvimarina sp. 2208YS6-2-32]|uniref:DUF1513 domain-containing protein n=1 Tax=Fulvimarina uroteuthidis TaxID=3098149 RepID=A0ABU5I0R0_9HYPH|nr:DUF1513 domain-containing protein [Fulvimarina sp. 2208YS6-2-32]MDY8108975.1 DUF1513 domain-containing protein [Fulvimarina sp. 2208YS6-2-32]
MIPTPLISRRAFLSGAGAAFAAGLLPREADALAATDALFASAVRRADGSYGCAVFAEDGRILCDVPLPGRGHDVAFDPLRSRAVAFARRPRTFAVVFDPVSGTITRTLGARKGRHFFGHGFFSPDGRLLYATENDYAEARGLIGVYDVERGFVRIGEFETHGMDTHEALLMPDGETIVVANGGIETHPDYGRQKLNLPTMDPSLVFIDRRTGDLIGQHRLPGHLHQLSIRHLAIDDRARVWFGCQYEGPSVDAPQLAGFASPDGGLTLCDLPRKSLVQLCNYVGSVAASRDGARIALSSPVGGTFLILDAGTGRVVGTTATPNGCGLAPSGRGFLTTDGDGRIGSIGNADSARHATAPVSFDNHVLSLRRSP